MALVCWQKLTGAVGEGGGVSLEWVCEGRPEGAAAAYVRRVLVRVRFFVIDGFAGNVASVQEGLGRIQWLWMWCVYEAASEVGGAEMEWSF